MKIAFYDSGMGGLSVLNHAMRVLPNEEYLYFADTDNVPYGTKTKEEIISFADEAVSFMVERGVKANVIACNTATSVAIRYLREKYSVPILGMEPAVKPAILSGTGKKVLVTATPLTVRGEKLKNLIEEIDGEAFCDLLPLPRLVNFAENMEFNSPKVKEYLQSELSGYNLSEYSHIVLGCTHFNYFKEAFRGVLPSGIEFIGGMRGTVSHLKNTLLDQNLLENNNLSVDYYYSKRYVSDKENLEKIKIYHNWLDKMYLIDRT